VNTPSAIIQPIHSTHVLDPSEHCRCLNLPRLVGLSVSPHSHTLTHTHTLSLPPSLSLSSFVHCPMSVPPCYPTHLIPSVFTDQLHSSHFHLLLLFFPRQSHSTKSTTTPVLSDWCSFPLLDSHSLQNQYISL
jgi:hypothetical protein